VNTSDRVNKSELVGKMAAAADLPKVAAERALEAFCETVSDELQKGNEISLIGFGTFKVKERKAKTGHNPQTGAPINIPAANVPKFTPGKALKEAVN
jgi:DNA-binding protein HU-beta